jgi:hypothetical protein
MGVSRSTGDVTESQSSRVQDLVRESDTGLEERRRQREKEREERKKKEAELMQE